MAFPVEAVLGSWEGRSAVMFRRDLTRNGGPGIVLGVVSILVLQEITKISALVLAEKYRMFGACNCL